MTGAAAARPIALEASWLRKLRGEFEQPYMGQLREFLQSELQAGKQVYPPGAEIFNAFAQTPFEAVKVVILGQDPYHGPGQAHGLCFSVRPGVRPPPSLLNIFLELEQDLGRPMRRDYGCLLHWARQGVLLLNSVLTVVRGQAGAHQGKGWEQFTDRAVQLLNEQRENLVFLLWGANALRKGRIVDPRRHLVLQAPHPSPLSASRGFFGCKHFSRTNAWLAEHGMKEIDWQLAQEG